MSNVATFQDTALTLGGLIFFGGIVWSIFKGRDWLDAKMRAEAEIARREAREAKELAAAAHEKVAILQSALTAYRETQAERLVSREVLREVEGRLADSIEQLGTRLDNLVREIIQSRRSP